MQSQDTIPIGLCQCGCGQRTRLAPQSHTQLGWVKGQPIRHVQGHKSRRPASITRSRQPLAERFWRYVERLDGPDACWLWIGAKLANGYGVLHVSDGIEYAHRISWILHHGPIPGRMEICHHCDNPPCVRDEHLFIGTHADNMADAARKGRWARCP